MGAFSLSYNSFSKLFPFAFAINKSGDLTSVGPSLAKLNGKIKISDNFFDHLEFTRPTNIKSLDSFQKLQGEMIILVEKSTGAKLMGQIIAENHLFIFVVNLLVTDGEHLSKLKLDFNDFPIQDQIFDFLMLTQTQRMMIQQTDQLNKELLYARNIAEKASRMKSQFLANMSHELRTPMNGILGMSSVLLETPLTDEQKEFVKIISASGESMVNLINDILDLSKIEAGHIKVESAPLDLRQCLTETESAVALMAQKKGLSMNFTVAPEIPQQIVGDKNRIKQILLNFISNGIKFTEQGFVDVNVELENQKIKFLVTDTGIGMDKETIQKIFSPFVQADSSLSKKFGGTGLGLSICKMLAEAMGGNVGVSSAEGAGSTFWFTIKY